MTAGLPGAGPPRAGAAEPLIRVLWPGQPFESDGLPVAGAAGIVTLMREHPEQALGLWQALAPTPERDGNIALCLSRLGRFDQALAAAAGAAAATEAEARYIAALEFLRHGDFARGWPLYAERAKRAALWSDFARTTADIPRAPAPDGLAGRPVLAYADQGLGDQVMFAGFIAELLDQGLDLTVATDPRLTPLLAPAFPAARFVSDRDAVADPGAFAAKIALGDCGASLRPSFASFPARAGYLRPPGALVRSLRASYKAFAGGRLLVGLAWRSYTTKADAHKSVPLEALSPVLGQDAAFLSLQYRPSVVVPAPTLSGLGLAPRKVIEDPRFDPFTDTGVLAAQIAACDLVITSSNVTAHLAGALDKPALVLLPHGFGLQWHWFLNRADSPWYRALTLLRQSVRGDWSAPVAAAAEILAARIAAGAATSGADP